MAVQIYGFSKLILTVHFLSLIILSSALPRPRPSQPSNPNQINSNSILVALLDSHYTILSELVEKALLLQTLESAVGHHNITIFAPRNEALERDLDPEFKGFLLEPCNLKSLQTLLKFHILPTKIGSDQWPGSGLHQLHHTLSNDPICLFSKDSQRKIDLIKSLLKLFKTLARVFLQIRKTETLPSRCISRFLHSLSEFNFQSTETKANKSTDHDFSWKF